jgi:hypothetical protein
MLRRSLGNAFTSCVNCVLYIHQSLDYGLHKTLIRAFVLSPLLLQSTTFIGWTCLNGFNSGSRSLSTGVCTAWRHRTRLNCSRHRWIYTSFWTSVMGEAIEGAAAPMSIFAPGCPPVELSYLCNNLSMSNSCFSLFVVDCGRTVTYSERRISCCLLNVARQHTVEVTRQSLVPDVG